MSSIRVIEVPPNRKGIPEGTWVEWPSLQRWLLEMGHTEIEATLNESVTGDAPPLLTKEWVVR